MSFAERLEHELVLRRVRPAVRRRILLEYADHIASDPGTGETRLGDPAELAGQFAAELAADDARRSTRHTFLALCATALALVLGQLAIGPAGGYQGADNGRSIVLWIPAILTILCAPQVALVTGLLAAARALRRRHAPVIPDAEVALIHRRCLVAAGAGLLTCGGLLLYTVNFSGRLSSWWVAMQGGLAALAAFGLGLAVRESLHCRLTVGGEAGAPGDQFGDATSFFGDLSPRLGDLSLLRTLRMHPLRAAALVTVLAAGATTLLTAQAEHSLVEGLERGGFEAIFVAAGIAVTRAVSRYCAVRWRSR